MTTKVDGTRLFPLAGTNNPMVINRYIFEYLAPDEMKVVQLLDVFKVGILVP